MATAYTPGLKVTPWTHIRKMRRLPLAGEVLVVVGQSVDYADVLARAQLPGIMRTVRAAELMGVDPKDLDSVLRVKEGDSVEKGAVLCSSTSFFGVFKNECKCPVSGKIELINPLSGNIGVREAPSPVEVIAYVRGTVTEVLPREGAVVETDGALVQGIFGVGGEENGTIRVISEKPDGVLGAGDIPSGVDGCILIGGAGADLPALRAASEAGAVGLMVGAVVDSDLVGYLGYDIGVAITGEEPLGCTVILTEGFGRMPMAARTWELLGDLQGKRASINGATQIRAGVIRPELIVAEESVAAESTVHGPAALDVGSPIRLIRDPYLGMLGKVADLPSDLREVPSGAKVRVLIAELSDGRKVVAPRANVELIEQ